jgi:hypothetical protein
MVKDPIKSLTRLIWLLTATSPLRESDAGKLYSPAFQEKDEGNVLDIVIENEGERQASKVIDIQRKWQRGRSW